MFHWKVGGGLVVNVVILNVQNGASHLHRLSMCDSNAANTVNDGQCYNCITCCGSLACVLSRRY